MVLFTVLGYALLAALCFGTLFLLYAVVRWAAFTLSWIIGLSRQIPRLVHCRSGRAGGSRSSDNRVATAVKAAAVAGAAVVGGGGSRLWDETLMTLLGGPGPPDPFPEDSLEELDGPAVDR